MLLKINPTITGGFVHHILRDKKVKRELEKLGIIEEDKQHTLVKEIIIAATRDLQIDFNKKLNIEVDKILDSKE